MNFNKKVCVYRYNIKWEEKALGLAKNDKAIQETLDKMKKGEKTLKE